MSDNDIIAARRIKKAFQTLNAAKFLQSGAMYEDVCNKTYYAVYNAIRSVAGIDDKEFSSHSENIGWYRKEYLKTNIHDRALSDIITETKALREGSDYNDEFEITEDESSHAIEIASEFCEYINEYIQLRISKYLEKGMPFQPRSKQSTLNI